MKKMHFPVLFFLMVALLYPVNIHAQMMRNPSPQANDSQNQTAQDEAAGKAIWDKLQDKQLSCGNLTDDQFDVLGDFFMGNMMGANHDYMNELMAQRLGDNGEKQMHITLGKRLSGCDSNASFPKGANYFMPMMGFSAGMMNNTNTDSWGRSINGMMGYGNLGNSYGIFGLLVPIGLFVFLTLGSIYFWKKLQKK